MKQIWDSQILWLEHIKLRFVSEMSKMPFISFWNFVELHSARFDWEYTFKKAQLQHVEIQKKHEYLGFQVSAKINGSAYSKIDHEYYPDDYRDVKTL